MIVVPRISEVLMATRLVGGRLEVVCGSMFSGKSEELIRRMRRAQIARQKTQLFKHSNDNRRSISHVDAHSGMSLEACAVRDVAAMEKSILPDTEVVGIDEVQFFSPEITVLLDRLVSEGRRVIAAGLDLDFRGVPFGCMPVLLALADDVLKLKAVCVKSGADARFSQRLIDGNPANHNDPIICVGAQDCYEARSRECFEIDYKPLAEYIKRYFGGARIEQN